jgi:cytochrome c-type biogenesis protein CcmH
MTQFWIAALALGLVAAAFVLVPVLRAWRLEGAGRSSSTLGIGIVLALAIPVTANMLYARWSTWDWGSGGGRAMGTSAEAEHEMEDLVAALEERLNQRPEDLEGWMMLGRSYMSMGRYGDGARAFRQAANLDGNQNPQILADLGEAIGLSDPMGLQGEAAGIFERVLAQSPSHPKALWYGGLNAFENSDFVLAEQRLSLLLTLNPPETLVPIIEERITAARAHTGAMPATPEDRSSTPAGTPAPEVPAVAAAPAQQEATAAPTTASNGIQLQISLDPALAARIPGPTPVFIIARNSGGGPPLAVIRSSSAELPLAVELTDANAMMEGVTITDQPELELVARVALSGSPAQRPGDLFGAVNYARGNSGPTRIRIDQVAE